MRRTATVKNSGVKSSRKTSKDDAETLVLRTKPSAFSLFAAMADVVEAVMGKLPESRRKKLAGLHESLVPLVVNQFPDLVLGNRQTPGIGRGGGMFIASGPTVYVFNEGGREEPCIPADVLGLCDKTFAVTCDPVSRLVIAADCNGDKSILVAFKMHIGEPVVRWRSEPGEVYNCYGVTLLPQQVIYGCVLYKYFDDCSQ